MRGRNDPALEAKWRCLNLNRGTVADASNVIEDCHVLYATRRCGDEMSRGADIADLPSVSWWERLFGSCLIIPVKELISPTVHNRENVPYRAEGAARVDWD